MGTENVFYKWGSGVGADLPNIKSAHDEFLVAQNGDEIIDAASAAVVINLGHSVPGVGELMKKQVEDGVALVMTSNFTSDPLEELAEKLAEMTPGDLNTSFFVSSGSQTVDSAMKLVRRYHQENGDEQKTTFISRWQSYHGATIGALSLTGNTHRRSQYKPLLKNYPHIPPAYPYRWEYEGSPEEQAIQAAQELETAIQQEGPETVAAFVAEPVSGSSVPAAHPHPAYFKEIRRICDEYNVVFIADEIMTGFGRTGEMFGMENFGVVPDIMVIGKGLSSGYSPISGVVVNDEIAAQFDSRKGSSFAHGFTYAGNPLSAAVASHVLDYYTDEVIEQGQARGDQLRERLGALEDHPIVGDIRQKGLMLGVEFVADTATKEPFDPELKVYKRVYNEALDRGVYTFPGRGSADGTRGDHIMMAPPLITGEDSIDQIADVVSESVEVVYDQIT
ncbi:aspartate aminotransferase family protein [Salinigranum marinum]|uniref:aminotransferase family protein n=1 Tax=Salinigranum marinum TaxID=1515595 RepID=UPI00298A0751|nr:aspartate aminotransferase family protein [Salinigranum marinum]